MGNIKYKYTEEELKQLKEDLKEDYLKYMNPLTKITQKDIAKKRGIIPAQISVLFRRFMEEDLKQFREKNTKNY